VLAWAVSNGRIASGDAIYSVPALFIVAAIVFLKWRDLSRLNRFGIYERGISPPRRIHSPKKTDGRLFIPYADVERFEDKKTGARLFPSSHFGVLLYLKSKDALEFDATQISAQCHWDEKQTARAEWILEPLATDLEAYGSVGPFRFRWTDNSPKPDIPND